MEYIRQELEELQEKEARVSGQEKSFYIGGDGSGIGDLETGIAALYRKRKVLEFVITTALIFGIGGALAVAGITKSLITANGHWCDRHCGRSRRLSCENACI